MTFFIKETPAMPPRGPNVALPSNSDGVGAGFRTALRSVDQYIGLNATKDKEATPLALQAGERLGVDALHTYFADRAQQTMPGAQTPKYPDVQTYIDVLGADAVLNVAREKALADPDAWADMDIAPESIEAKAIERQKAEEAADQQLIALSPNPIRNSLVGALGAGVVDPINIAAAPLGLGGSFIRVVGREMVIGATIEALQHPTRVKVAERLDQEAPNLAESMAIGALTGGVFAGVLDGIPRALRAVAYYREMKKVEAAPDVGLVTQEAAIQKAEAAISEGKPGAQAAADVILQEPTAPRRPLILDDSMRVQPEPTPLAPDPITTEPLAPVEGIPNTVDQITATAKTGINKGGRPATKEVLGWLKKQGVDPDGWLGKELKSRGLTNKTNRGLFRKGGLTDADNIVAGEVDQSIGGISYRAGTDDTGMYLDREGIIRLVEEEISGPRKAYNRDYVPERAWADPDPEQRGFLVNDLPARQFAEPETWRQTLEADVDRYLEAKGALLLPRERDEIMEVIATRGGDVEDLLYSAMSREIDEAEQAVIRTMRGEAYGRSDVPWGEETGVGPVPDRAGGSVAGEPEAAGGDAAQLGARGVEPAVERTGAAPVSQSAPAVKPLTGADLEAMGLTRAPQATGDAATTVEETQWMLDRYSNDVEAGKEHRRELEKMFDDVSDLIRRGEWSYEDGRVRQEQIARRILVLRHLTGQTSYRTTPINSYTAGPVKYSKDVAEWEKAVIDSVFKEFGFDKAISVVRIADTARSNASVQRKANLLWGERIELSLPRMGAKTIKNAETLLHELGHIMENFLIDKSPNLRARLFTDWVNSINFDRFPLEYFAQVGGARQARKTGVVKQDEFTGNRLRTKNTFGASRMADREWDYPYSFLEWFAQQTSRFLEADRAVEGVVAKFFSRVADIWKAIRGALREQGFTAPSVQQLFENARIKSLDEMPDKAPPTTPKVERTDIGDQYLIPDTRRVETGDAQRQKAELEARQLQSKMRRLNQARVEDDVDGLFAARSLDMFDDLSSPEAREFMDANIQAMRDMLDEGDVEIGAVADDGRVLTNLSDILDEIDDEETLIREFNLCRLGGGTTE